MGVEKPEPQLHTNAAVFVKTASNGNHSPPRSGTGYLPATKRLDEQANIPIRPARDGGMCRTPVLPSRELESRLAQRLPSAHVVHVRGVSDCSAKRFIIPFQLQVVSAKPNKLFIVIVLALIIGGFIVPAIKVGSTGAAVEAALSAIAIAVLVIGLFTIGKVGFSLLTRNFEAFSAAHRAYRGGCPRGHRRSFRYVCDFKPGVRNYGISFGHFAHLYGHARLGMPVCGLADGANCPTEMNWSVGHTSAIYVGRRRDHHGWRK